jgi:hypothetical protein
MRFFAAIATLAIIGNAGIAAAEEAAQQVVFVCEHGVVKSQMATSYFNQLAQQRGLPWRAVSRGSAPDAKQKVDATDAAAAARIVTIGATLPADVPADEKRIERWDDVPPASANYDAARSALEARVAELLERLSRESD